MVFLHSPGVGTARAVRIYKTYDADAIQVMTENPYRLARNIRGIGFKTADATAIRLGVQKTAMIRIRAGVSYALTQAIGRRPLRIADRRTGAAHRRVGCATGTRGDRAEQVIAERLRRLADQSLPWTDIDLEKVLPWIERKIGLALAATQTAATRMALRSWVPVITGGPGVGKTTIVNAILCILAAKGMQLLCAPDRPRSQAYDGSHRLRSQDHSPTARGRPDRRRIRRHELAEAAGAGTAVKADRQLPLLGIAIRAKGPNTRWS